jgi:XTP/dITP diphosphohydrolase
MPAMRVIVATSNHGKLLEFREALEPLGWDLMSLEGFDVKLPPEDGFSYEENAFIKAAYTAAVTGIATIADDSGLEVDALDGAPGLYSARYGNKASDLERNLYLLTNLLHVPMPRRAKFVSVVALAFPDGRCETYRGECHGEILEGPRGDGGFGYDPLFFVPELGKTFGEADVPAKRAVSHRGNALRALLNSIRVASSSNPLLRS